MISELIAGFIFFNAPQPCTFGNPYPPIAPNQICTGYNSGSYCTINAVSCSPVPGTPGTWNPSGYTPKIG